ncbi:MAG: helix-turn-helix domain-containing protein [Sphingomonadaceae bacterium]
MITLPMIDMMARGGAMALLLLTSWLLVRDHRGALSARIALLMLLSIVAHVIGSIPGSLGYGPVVDGMLLCGSTMVPGSFWLFARVWFNDEVRIGWISWAIALLPPILFATFVIMAGRPTGPFPVGFAMRLISFALAIAGLWAAWRGRDGDLIEARRRLRAQLIWGVGGFVILTNAAEILINNDRGPDMLPTLIEIGILWLTALLCGAMFAIRQTDLFAAATPPPLPDKDDNPSAEALAARLTAHMAASRAYRDDGLTIAGLAAQLGEQEYRLRRLINGRLGHRNFAAFLNGYRLAEVKAALDDPSQREVPILTIALDAGFGSLGPFNRAFREAEDCTPSDYRRRALAGAP